MWTKTTFRENGAEIVQRVQMTRHMFRLHRFCLGIALYSLLFLWALPTTYMLTIVDIKEFPKYEKLWKDIFQIR
jgi:hypothetical protein